MDIIYKMAALIVFITVTIFFETRKLIKKKLWVNFFVYISVMIIGAVLMSTWILGLYVPPPFKALGLY